VGSFIVSFIWFNFGDTEAEASQTYWCTWVLWPQRAIRRVRGRRKHAIYIFLRFKDYLDGFELHEFELEKL
jgi:hypothetical protein